MTRLWDLLSLVRRLAAVDDPWWEESGLRAYIEIIIDGSELIGVPEKVLDMLNSALSDPQVFNIALAVAQFLHGHLGVQASDVTTLDFTDQAVLDWITLLPQIIAIIEEIRKLWPRK